MPFQIHEDELPPTPPDTQLQSHPTQWAVQESTQQRGPQKKAKKSSKKPPQKESTLKAWEVDFEAAESAKSKLQVLLLQLGHEVFPDMLFVPERQPEVLLSNEEVDPLNPLRLWSLFISPDVLQIIADSKNENESLDLNLIY